jgi:hypothetical protein
VALERVLMFSKILIFVVVVVLLLFVQQASAQVSRQTHAEAQLQDGGLYYLVLSGDQGEINRICAYGDCGRASASRIDALNYWVSLMSQAYGISIVPIPPPPGG